MCVCARSFKGGGEYKLYDVSGGSDSKQQQRGTDWEEGGGKISSKAPWMWLFIFYFLLPLSPFAFKFKRRNQQPKRWDFFLPPSHVSLTLVVRIRGVYQAFFFFYHWVFELDRGEGVVLGNDDLRWEICVGFNFNLNRHRAGASGKIKEPSPPPAETCHTFLFSCISALKHVAPTTTKRITCFFFFYYYYW